MRMCRLFKCSNCESRLASVGKENGKRTEYDDEGNKIKIWFEKKELVEYKNSYTHKDWNCPVCSHVVICENLVK